MQSRRDQVQAYFFVVGRMVAAVTHGRPDVPQAPNRRLTTGTAYGVLVAGLLVGIFGIIGLFFPGGNTSWRQPGAIVMDRSSGARYVYLDGQLRPVLNYSSARLVSGASTRVASVSQNSLRNTPVGQPIGIPGAPDSLPPVSQLNADPWTVCAQPGGDLATTGRSTVSLLLNRPAGVGLTDSQAMLVSTPDGVDHLLWQGRRHRISSPAVLQALGYADVVPIPVSPSWLNPLPSARDLAVPDLDRAGDPGPSVDRRPRLVGQVFEVRNPAIDSDQLYLLRHDGVTALSRTTAALVLAADETRRAYPGLPVAPIEVGPAALVDVPRSAGPDLVSGLPAVPPEAVVLPPGSVLCARYTHSASGEANAALELRSAGEVTAGSVPVAEHTAGTVADRVAIPAGSGVLARELLAPGAAVGATFLITDIGVRFPLQDSQAMTSLGYSESSVVSVPGQLLDLLPLGPVLSTTAALRAQVP